MINVGDTFWWSPPNGDEIRLVEVVGVVAEGEATKVTFVVRPGDESVPSPQIEYAEDSAREQA